MAANRDVYVKTALFGLALYFVAVLIIMVTILIAAPEDTGEILVLFGVPGAIVGAALIGIRRWGLLVGILGGALGTLFVLEDIDLYISTPQSFFTFSSTWFALVGVLTLLLASLTGTVQYFRNRVGADASRLSPAFYGVGAVLGVLALISAVVTALNIESVSNAEAEGAVVVTSEKAVWDAKLIEAEPGRPLRILVKNDDPVFHTFTIHDLDIDVFIGPWSEKLIELPPLESRIYGFICRLEGHKADMTGAIDVR
jgi:hypothetical protein